MMLDPAPGDDGVIPAYWVTVSDGIQAFSIDGDVFADWVADEGDELVLPAPGDDAPGLILSDLVYRALSADVLISDPGIELNIHDDIDGYFVRLNNRAGRQLLVGLTGGRHELRWSPKGLTPNESARHYLQEICGTANALLAELLTAPA